MRRDALPVLGRGHDIVDGDGLDRRGPHEELCDTAQAEDQVQRWLLLDDAVPQSKGLASAAEG